MKRLRAWLREWLGIDDVDTGLRLESQFVDNGFEVQQDQRAALEEMVRKMAETDKGLATALQAAVAQLNRNTVMMQRWSTESATLGEIERKHARREQRETALAGNGHARIITPEGL